LSCRQRRWSPGSRSSSAIRTGTPSKLRNSS
jgi:hypothetical protein